MKSAGRCTALLAALVAAAALPLSASAATAKVQQVGDVSARFITDFVSLSGATVDSSTALSGNLAATGADYGVKSGYGADDGNAFVLGLGDASKVSQGLYSEATYNPLMDENAKMEGLSSGATDFIYYLNAGGEPEDSEAAMQIVIGEYDYDENGEPVMQANPSTGVEENAITFWMPADAVDTEYYTMADGSSEWVKHTGTSGAYVRVEAGFKGYVRIPLEMFDPVWSSRDVNGKWDLKTITRVSFYYGLYPRHEEAGYAIAVDNIGFAGDFVDVIETTPISGATISAIADQTYTGSAIKPSFTVTDGDKTLVEGTDYTVAFSNNIDEGTAAVVITGIGQYTGTKQTTFKIVKTATGTEPSTSNPPTGETGKGASLLLFAVLGAAVTGGCVVRKRTHK